MCGGNAGANFGGADLVDERGTARALALGHDRQSSPLPGVVPVLPGGPSYSDPVIFKAVGDSRPYPAHGRDSVRDWAEVLREQKQDFFGSEAFFLQLKIAAGVAPPEEEKAAPAPATPSSWPAVCWPSWRSTMRVRDRPRPRAASMYSLLRSTSAAERAVRA